MKKLLVLLVLCVSLLLLFSPVFAGGQFQLTQDGAGKMASIAEHAAFKDVKNGKTSATFSLIKNIGAHDNIAGTSYEIDSAGLQSLSSKDKTKMLKTFFSEVKDGDMSQDDKQAVYTAFQAEEGASGAIIAVVMSNSKPDFLKAMAIFEPFNNPLGTVMALGCIILIAFLGLTMVCDIAYMSIPFLRVSNANAAGGSAKPNWVSSEAYSAVLEAEGSGVGGAQTGGGSKQVIWVYGKKRVIMLILLGLAILYLIQGKVFEVVAFVVNLASGM